LDFHWTEASSKNEDADQEEQDASEEAKEV
jgi:hypothetical protein